jgi:Mn-dependent DtxR family transcriptional regulator
MKKQPLSNREEECFGIIKDYYKTYKLFPTHVFVADKMGIKTRQQVTAIYARLHEKGYIKKTPRWGMYTL